MMNRFSTSFTSILAIVAIVFVTSHQSSAQSTCENPGDLFTLTYNGPDTFYVDENNCQDTLVIGTGSFTVDPTPSSVNFSAALTGYNLGSQIPSGVTVTMHYIVSGNGVTDTLCFDIVFWDSIPPQMNYTIVGDTVACDTANYAGWIQAQLDSLAANATDNCAVDTIYHDGPAAFNDLCGEITVTFYVEDPSGNKASQTATYKIVDDEAPTLVGVPADVFIACTDPIPTAPTVTATDNCDSNVTVNFTESSSQTSNGSCTDYTYTILRTWTATDQCGNTVEMSQVINVEDLVEPDFDVPADTVVACGTNTDTIALGNISNISDNCDSGPTIAFTETINPGACPQEQTIVRTWTLTDACGNSRTRQQTITVIDTVPPTADFPADVTVDCSDQDNLNVTGQPSNVSDNCDDSPEVTSSDVIVAGSCTNELTIYRTWTVSDACGNSIDSVQVITVTDLTRPVIDNPAVDAVYICTLGQNQDSLFQDWIDAHGGATAKDNCTLGPQLTWSAYLTGTSTPAYLLPPTCTPDSNQIYRSTTVDFVVMDNCGNTDTTTATFIIVDNQAPVLSQCPSNQTVSTDPGICGNNFLLNLPMVEDECGNVFVSDTLVMSEVLSIPAGSDPVETPVNDVVFNFSVPGPPYQAQSNVRFTFTLNDVDAEAPTEYLNVYGEGGLFIGSIAHTPVQCGDTTTSILVSPALYNQWAFDGVVTITIKPNIPAGQPGRFSVNPICPGGSVTAELIYTLKFPQHLKFEYAIDNGPRVAVSPIAPVTTMLELGTNTITYYFTDCVGNESTCSYQVTVQDDEPPTIVCPSSLSYSLPTGACEMDVTVPLFTWVSDNCSVTQPTTQTQPDQPADKLITYSYNPNLNDFVADDKVFTFTGLPANATPGQVTLTIVIQADVDSAGAYFEIYDPDNNLLGTTAKGQPNVTPGDCNTPSIVTFQIPSDTFNDWASNGSFQITARSFQGYPIPPAGPGWGINPCDPSQVNADGDTDGSFMYATISYESVSPTFSIDGATTYDPETLMPPLEPQTVTLLQGLNTVHYSVTDLNGNANECTFDIEIQDNEPPKALCGPSFVEINPSGFVIDTIYPAEIDLGSSDNCGIASMTVSPNTITCNSPSTVNVTLTVTDLVGNVSTCNTFVGVSTAKPQPTVTSPCGSSSLQFFANPPASPGGNNVYQYTWYNPQGIPFAYVQNPVIQNATMADVGFYNVVIRGVTGCEAVNTVQVTCDLLPLPTPAISASANSICFGESIQLSTAQVCGSDVTYKWYTGTPPQGMLLAATTVPHFTMTPPASGSYQFYLIVERKGCSSAVSNQVTVNVKMKPVAVPQQTMMTLCEGESILLKSVNTPPNSTCSWTGPCGFSSSSCNPAPIVNATTCHAGIYTLVVTTDGCASDPATVAVNVFTKPSKPTVTNSTTAGNPACVGETVTLTATAIPGVISYQWISPMANVINTPSNILTIQSVDINKDAGQWRVKAIGNQCESELSEPTTVYVAPLPQAVTATASPAVVCEGQNVQLAASSASQNVSFLWKYPSGQQVAMPVHTIENVTPNHEGTYQLTVTTQFGCTATKSVFLQVNDRVKITGASSDAPACTTGPVDVHLTATLFPLDPGTYQYQWTGPNGYFSSSAVATIPAATSANSGTYTLVVTNQDGCSSLPKTIEVTIPEIVPTPVSAPTLSANNPFCEGQSVTLSAPAYQGNGTAEYVWNTPAGTIVTNSPSLVIDQLGMTDSGSYTVQYRVNNCLSLPSAKTVLVVNSLPVVMATSNSPVCQGGQLQLGVNCTTGATYEWTGPGGFSASVCNPVIPNVNQATHAGLYTVRKKVNGCWSKPVSLEVTVKPKPGKPVATNAGPYCANTDDVMLIVTSSSATPGATYTWYDVNGQPLGNPTPGLNFNLPNPEQYGEGTASFYVVATLDGCDSDPSAPTQVSLNTIPANAAEAGANIQACEGDIIQLAATPPTLGSGLWTLQSGDPVGVIIANPDQPNTTVSGLKPGVPYVFRWTLSNGACENYSYDSVTVQVNQLEQAEAGNQINACFTTSVQLDAVPASSNNGMWSQPATQAQLGVVIVDPTNPKTLVTGLTPGNEYLFTWTVTGGCGTSSDVVKVVVSNENAFAGADYTDCGEGCTVVNAVPALSGVGLWTSPDPAIEFVTPTNASTTVCGLKAGQNILVWTINGGACGHHSVDSVIVNYFFSPEATDDVAQVKFGGKTTLNALSNDVIPGDFTFSILQQPAHGKATADVFGNVTYEANINYIGEDFLVYELCVENCDCTTGTITFNVGNDAKCDIPSIITPNHDGINDAFIIPCLANLNDFTNNTLSIFNLWGDEVFRASPYRNDWEGTFDGEDLPAGTYYYILDLGNGQTPKTGYLIIQR